MSSKHGSDQPDQPFQTFLGHLKEYDNRADSFAQKILKDEELMREIALRCVLKHGLASFSLSTYARKNFSQLIHDNQSLKVGRTIIAEYENQALPLGKHHQDQQKFCLVPHKKILSKEFKSAGLREQFALAKSYPEVIRAVQVATCEKVVVREVSYKKLQHFPVLQMDDGAMWLRLIPEPLDASTMYLALVP